ncbi:MAG TPA: hypothetical protein VJ550_06085 [Geomonas sp.]|nr:hypothetical protein [Geomonas sp.]
MKRTLVATLVLVFGLFLIPMVAVASPIKTFVKDFAVSAPAPDNLKGTLKALLASRLRGDGIEVVDSEAEAEVVVSPSYTQLGKMFSLDAVAKSAPGRQLATAFEQGDNPDTVIASVGKLASKLKEEILKGYPAKEAVQPSQAPAATAAQPVPTIPAAAMAGQAPRVLWSSPRLTGAQSALAAAGAGLFLTVQGRDLLLYRKDAKFTIAARTEVPSRLKVVGLDTLAAPEGVLAFVSAMDKEEAASSVYQVTPGGFKLLAEKVPYLFRTVAPNGAGKELFAQQIGNDGQYYGDAYHASFAKGAVQLGKAVKLPAGANIFNFNTFGDRAGNTYTVAFTESGYLAVYSDAGKELWRSDDKFGGSENFIMGHDAENERFYGNSEKPRFLDQRITITERGDLIVPQNTGFLVVGNMRSYSKYSMVALSWNGSALEELWRTKQTQGYLADYLLEPGSHELVVLEVTQKEGVFGKGASAIRGIPVQ